MSRRSRWWAVLVLAAGVGGTAAALGYLAKREPDFYVRAGAEADWDTRERSSGLLTKVQDLKNDIRSKPEWGDTFNAADLNCFFAEHLSKKSALRAALPAGLHAPRVEIAGDRLRLGARYGDGFWSTVVWVELRAWLVAGEVNTVAVEVCDLRTGSLAVGTQSVLDAVAEAARESNVEVTWYRSGDNPVGLFRFYADQPQPPAQIVTLEVKDGTIAVAGRALADGGPVARGPAP